MIDDSSQNDSLAGRLDVERILGNGVALRALTGLDRDEFERLLPPLDKALARAGRWNWQGQPRQRAKGVGPKSGRPSTAHKLFSLLFYSKVYPLQHAMAALFGLAQSGVGEGIHSLTPVAQTARGRVLVKPARGPRALAPVLRAHPAVVLLDGTERPGRRPSATAAPRRHDRGKQQRPPPKNLVVTAARRVLYLGPTEPGARADKTLAGETQLRWPEGTRLAAEGGLAGGVRSRSPAASPWIPSFGTGTESWRRGGSAGNLCWPGGSGAALCSTRGGTGGRASTTRSETWPAAGTTCANAAAVPCRHEPFAPAN